MKQLGNLAIICACRWDTLLQVLDGTVTVHAGRGSERAVMTADWADDERISEIIRELNFGRFAEGRETDDEVQRGLRRPA
jgi:hypothetical protein